MHMLNRLAAIAALFLAFWLVRWWRARAGQRPPPAAPWHQGLTIDLLYWLAAPTAAAWLTRAAMGALLLAAGWLLSGNGAVWDGFGPLARLPVWAQATLALVCADFANYWTHRALHTRRLWPLHAVHHSSTQLDWHSALRIHPLDRIAMRAGVWLFLLLVGFPPGALAGAGFIAGFIGILVHIDTRMDFGRLSWFITTPQFHRWHHADDREAQGRNFAGIFPVWDLLFGTYFVPANRQPSGFGAGAEVAANLHAHLVAPVIAVFRR